MNKSAKAKRANAIRNVPAAIRLKRQAECDAVALKIVEQLIEPNVDVNWMLQNITKINRSHMEDVAEERALSKLCGYVLCDNPLTKLPTKKYQISLSQKKIYDLEKVKNYCSSSCHQAMEHLFVQMYTSPLWIKRNEIKTFSIFSKSTSPDSPGVEVVMSLVDESIFTEEELSLVKNQNENPSNSKEDDGNGEIVETINQSLQDCKLEGEKRKLEKSDAKLKSECKLSKKVKFKDDSELVEYSSTVSDDLKRSEECSGLQCADPSPNDSLSVEESCLMDEINRLKVEDQENDNSMETDVKKCKPTFKPKPVVTVFSEPFSTRLERHFNEWITEKTKLLLRGTAMEKKEIYDNIAYQNKHEVLCKKLTTLQLNMDNDDSDAEDAVKPSKPLPHFDVLKEETVNSELKVQAYYSGKMNVDKPVEKETSEDATENSTLVIPGISRRDIFLDKLKLVVPDLLQTLTEPSEKQFVYLPEKVSKLKTLVSTFSLSAKNIVFKTSEWTVVGLLIIKLMSILDPAIEYLLSTKHSNNCISMILMSYDLDLQYLDKLIQLKIPPEVKNECLQEFPYEEQTNSISLVIGDDDHDEEFDYE